jgi:hypothetical protein
MSPRIGFLGTIVAALILAACSPNLEPGAAGEEGQEPEYDIITLLPKDAIPSIDRPRFYSIQEADAEYEPDEVVMGVEFNGDARAYSVGLLSSHEIVNDMVGGRPIAVTW